MRAGYWKVYEARAAVTHSAGGSGILREIGDELPTGQPGAQVACLAVVELAVGDMM